MTDFMAKMHQIRFRLRLCPRPRWGELAVPPGPQLYLGPTSKARGGEGWRGEETEWEGRGGRKSFPLFLFYETTTGHCISKYDRVGSQVGPEKLDNIHQSCPACWQSVNLRLYYLDHISLEHQHCPNWWKNHSEYRAGSGLLLVDVFGK